MKFLRAILPLLERDPRGVSLNVEDKRSGSSENLFRFQQLMDVHDILKGLSLGYIFWIFIF